MKRALFLFLMFAFPSIARADLDLVFLVDTTGSMGGEIREAKDTIKQMSETITASRKGEVVRIGVIAFRDKGDDYVTRVSPLSRSVDDSFKFLSTLRAGGGGDHPEDVLAALDASLTEIGWDKRAAVERQVFLIGDAPPHFDYPDRPKPAELIERARRDRIVFNTIGCRSLPAHGISFFRKMAYETEGVYQHIGSVQVGDGGLKKAVLDSVTKTRAPEEWARDAIAIKPKAVRKGPAAPRGAPRVFFEEVPRDSGKPVPGQEQGKTDETFVTGDGCTLVISLPDGVALRGTPTIRISDEAVFVDADVSEGSGETVFYELPKCVPPTTPVRVQLGGSK